jgi:hypothetical protein
MQMPYPLCCRHFLCSLAAKVLCVALCLGVFAQEETPPSSDNTEAQNIPVEIRPLLKGGGFDLTPGTDETQSPPPVGWSVNEPGPGVRLALSREQKLSGSSALKIEAGEQPAQAVSEPMPVEPTLKRVNASVLAYGSEEATALLRWRKGTQVLREDTLPRVGKIPSGWLRFRTQEVTPPEGADTVVLVLSVPAHSVTYWDQATINGEFERLLRAGLWLNQLGYEKNAPKRFVAHCATKPRRAAFEIRDEHDTVKYTKDLEGGDRIVDAWGNDWGAYFYRGDFTDFMENGKFKVVLLFDEAKTESAWFEIANDVLWRKTAGLQLHALRSQRCDGSGGVTDPCHAPSTEFIPGGWHDGTLCTRNHTPEVFWYLVEGYRAARWRHAHLDEDKNGTPDVLEEIQWGADYLTRTLEENTWRDELDRVASGFAALTRFVPENETYRTTAQKLLDMCRRQALTTPYVFAAAVDLALATNNDEYRTYAQTLFRGPSVEAGEIFSDYEDEWGRLGATFELGKWFIEKADALLPLANNPFGVYMYDVEGTKTFFGTPGKESAMPLGNTAHILEAANLAARAFRYAPKPEYAAFVYDQLNWLFGVNPFGVCLMAGVGEKNLRAYALPSVSKSAALGGIPGMLANGFTGRAPQDDRPYVDLESTDSPEVKTNGVSVRNTALYFNTLCHIKRIRYGTEDE